MIKMFKNNNHNNCYHHGKDRYNVDWQSVTDLCQTSKVEWFAKTKRSILDVQQGF